MCLINEINIILNIGTIEICQINNILEIYYIVLNFF